MTKFKPIVTLAFALVATISLPSQAVNLIKNGEFNSGLASWQPPGWWAGGNGSSEVDSQGRFCTTVSQLGTDDWGAQLRQVGINFTAGETYDVSLRAWSTVPMSIEMSAVDETDGFVWLFGSSIDINSALDGDGQKIKMSLVAGADAASGNFRFLLGAGLVPLNETICFDDVVVDGPGKPVTANIIDNGDFSNGQAHWESPGWWAGGDGSSGVDDLGRYCTTVTQLGTDDWGAQLRQNDLTYVKDAPYDVSFKAWSSVPMTLSVGGVDESGGFVSIFGSDFSVDSPLTGDGQDVTLSFTAAADSQTGKFRFVMGAGLVPLNETVCFDDVVVIGPQEEEEPEIPAPPVHVNQVGYLPANTKHASYALPSDAVDFSTPRPWSLVQADVVVASGDTVPFGIGMDAASGDLVHIVDFSSYNVEGDDYTLVVIEGENTFTSEPFTIGFDIYKKAKYDALAYFYHNRSGTPILAELVGEPWSRPAGHESDVSVRTLACLEGENTEGCTTVDSFGGWYDAGDHGKYVVNGGISVWTMLNQYERFKYLGDGVDAFADGTMNLPLDEATNGVDDLLDEARWELEWIMKMQVAAGQPYAGAVYHKMHDENWTGLPLAPHEDTQTRYVHPPSTAATLNFAAVGAQCYRVFKRVDRAFAKQCLTKAIWAYSSAKKYPLMLANDISSGGGGYGDSVIDDEFYWAATELYLSTGSPFFAKEMLSSPLHMQVPLEAMSLMSWQQVNALGLISMATVGKEYKPKFGRVNKRWVKQARNLIVTAADQYAANVATEGYGVAISGKTYPWGSNSSVVNNMLVLGLAHDFTCSDAYSDALIQSADYLFGRNPLGHSYVTGYGTRAEQAPHHRFWAGILNANYPNAPAGALSGGPNSSLEDPFASDLLSGCSPQRCFVDNINAWSVNEITINWNAPFAWVTAYLDEYAHAKEQGSRACKINKHKHWY